MLFLDKNIDLSEVDLDIYKYILKNTQQVTYMRIRELAVNTHTSTASIQRFCAKFECSGFTEFKIRLKIYLEQHDKERSPANVDPTMYINFFKRTMMPDFQKDVQTTIDILKDCELILFLGVGSSNVMAEYGSLYFSSLFHFAMRIEDPVTYPRRFFPEDLLSKSCIIALSVSGETPEIINYLSDPSFGRCKIISITNSTNSTVAKLSDVNISYYISKESIVEQDVTSQVPCLFTLEYIARLLHDQMTSKNN